MTDATESYLIEAFAGYEQALAEEKVEIRIPFLPHGLLDVLGLGDRGDREITAVQETTDQQGRRRIELRIRGRFPVWAKDGDEVAYCYGQTARATLGHPDQEYVYDLQLAINRAVREVDRKWASHE